jgi:hypothetical protein
MATPFFEATSKADKRDCLINGRLPGMNVFAGESVSNGQA